MLFIINGVNFSPESNFLQGMDQNSQRFAEWQQEIFSLFLKRKNVFLENKKRTFNKEVRVLKF
jgi:spore cortex formation protein SpoVR/YcgB (stage V sporulation)